MKNEDIKERMRKSIIAVIRCRDIKLAREMAYAAIKSGIKSIEVTYTVEGAGALIEELKDQYPNIVIGAGTVLELSQAEDAIKRGTDFVVTPCIVEDVAVLCRGKEVFFSMAAATTTEIYNAYKMGSEVIKLFPGETYSPSIIKALHGPFPFVEFMPTGGINDKNIKGWFDAGAFAVGVGGYLTKGINFDNISLLEERAKKLINAIKY
ncbi:MAG: bifunctional 4-hydroxy-2-oxoglutarate aldolase/2-dehydro-3-deoxy-phosphogluconate aldolase [Clostridiales bacterium]|nr:bifunctional 4-hydroxy-2-oxoglutarate aldolase/2-dehydro-3-deoxy-phosphogluconate aldolase [Clostridiales bacterium]HBM81771.1 2-dehydro-3-deoxyphosphogluconate aldolase [Clostridiaceae bacterium]